MSVNSLDLPKKKAVIRTNEGVFGDDKMGMTSLAVILTMHALSINFSAECRDPRMWERIR